MQAFSTRLLVLFITYVLRSSAWLLQSSSSCSERSRRSKRLSHQKLSPLFGEKAKKEATSEGYLDRIPEKKSNAPRSFNDIPNKREDPVPLSPRQITLTLRNRIIQEGRELKRLWQDNMRLSEEIVQLQRRMCLIQLAEVCFGRFLDDGKYESMEFAKPLEDDEEDNTSMETAFYETVELIQIDSSGNLTQAFNDALSNHGFKMNSVSKAKSDGTIRLSLDFEDDEDDEEDIDGGTDNVKDEADDILAAIISSSKDSSASNENETGVIDRDEGSDENHPPSDSELIVIATLEARTRKERQDVSLAELQSKIQSAQGDIERNEWHMKYIALARECFAWYYNDGVLDDMEFENGDGLNAGVHDTLQRLWDEPTPHDRKTFNECLERHGLKYLKISYFDKSYLLSLCLLNQTESESTYH